MADKIALDRCKQIAYDMRLDILNMTYDTAKVGAHLGGSLSMVDLLAGLYGEILCFRNDDPNYENRDRVILSKGHAALALYAALAETGIIEKEELKTFKLDGSRLGGHPSLNGLPGIEFASGSLGQGLSLAVGVAMALLRKKNNTSRIYVFLGDGECDEGSVWEAAACASHFCLKNIIAIVDNNHIQYDGYTDKVLNMSPFKEKWISFGWDVVSINGHNMEEVLEAYKSKNDRPTVIIADTIKGKGVSFMENNEKYHNAMLSKDLYEKAKQEVMRSND